MPVERNENGTKTTDHDRLIMLNTNMKTMCSEITEIKTDIKELRTIMSKMPSTMPCMVQQDKCDKRFDAIDEKLGKRVKHSLITILLIIIAGVIGFNYTMDYSQWVAVSHNTEIISKNTKEIEKHIVDARQWMERIRNLEQYEKIHSNGGG